MSSSWWFSGRSLQSSQSSVVLFSRHHFRCCYSHSVHFIRLIIILMEAAKITIHLSRTESLQWPANDLTGKIMQVVTGLVRTMPVTLVWIPALLSSLFQRQKDIIIVPESRKHPTDRPERQEQTTIFCFYQLPTGLTGLGKTAYVRPARATFWQLRNNSCGATRRT